MPACLAQPGPVTELCVQTEPHLPSGTAMRDQQGAAISVWQRRAIRLRRPYEAWQQLKAMRSAKTAPGNMASGLALLY